jgi:hypothetical protein
VAGAINAMGKWRREIAMTPQDGRAVTGPYRLTQNNAFTAGTNWGRRPNQWNAYEAIKTIDGLSILSEAEARRVRVRGRSSRSRC